jgi:hypothetical protein
MKSATACFFILTSISGWAYAQGPKQYPWVGKDRACIVEYAIGLRPREDSAARDTFEWASAPKSFRLQARQCDEIPVDQTGWPECSNPGSVALRTPGFDRVESGWSDSTHPVFNSRDGISTIALEMNGKFYYSQIGTTADDASTAFFTLSGTCSPFDE